MEKSPYNCRIGKVSYKNVIQGNFPAKNDIHIEMKRIVDELIENTGGCPTGYYIAVFGDNYNKGIARAYHFTDECPVNAWMAREIIKNTF